MASGKENSMGGLEFSHRCQWKNFQPQKTVTLLGCERFRCTTGEKSGIKRYLKKITPKESVDPHRSGLWSQPCPYHSNFWLPSFHKTEFGKQRLVSQALCNGYITLHVSHILLSELRNQNTTLCVTYKRLVWRGERKKLEREYIVSVVSLYSKNISNLFLSLTVRISLPSPGPASPFPRTNETSKAPWTHVARGLLHHSKTCLYGKLLIQICHNRLGRSRTIRNMSAHLACTVL